jgi:peroxiredoxin family protein
MHILTKHYKLLEGTMPQAESAIQQQDVSLQQIEEQLAALKSRIDVLDKKATEPKVATIVFSGDLDKVLASFVIATGAVAMGMEAVMFFTFWGTPVLRDKKKSVGGKDIMGKMFGTMLPKGTSEVKLSKMNMGGMGTAMMRSLMKKKNVATLEQMLEMAEELGVKIFVCEMSMDLMGFKREEMIAYKDLTFCGVAKFLEEANNSRITLFI